MENIVDVKFVDIVLTYDCEQASCSNMLFLNYNILHSISNNRC